MTNDTQQFLSMGNVLPPQIKPDTRWINEVIDGFDFLRVQAAMWAIAWSYLGERDAPSIETLQAKVRSALKAATSESEGRIKRQSGGFCASPHPNEIVLTFVLPFAYVANARFGPLIERFLARHNKHNPGVNHD